MTTGFLYDPRFLQHDTGAGHPERRERVALTMDYLNRQGWFSRLVPVAARTAERRWIEQIHRPAYLERAAAACRQGLPCLDGPDTGIGRDSYEVARLATGGALALADAMLAGTVDNGFALVRPPGHHAEADLALGFCLFNNAAILARYLQAQHGLDKILVLDWDVHHGNGTQHAFEQDPSVLYVSLHQYPYYPGTGAASEDGSGRGQGATLNCPMAMGAGDEDYRRAFAQAILPKVRAFQPEAVVLSAGFDAHADDPLAQICLSTGFFGWMSERMMEVADQHAGGRLVSLLEGGYNLTALPRCVGAHLKVLSATPEPA